MIAKQIFGKHFAEDEKHRRQDRGTDGDLLPVDETRVLKQCADGE
jgi:hypothetical protein